MLVSNELKEPTDGPLFSTCTLPPYCTILRKGRGSWWGLNKVPALVMIVEDHPIIRRMVREIFEAEDFEVCDAAHGAWASRKPKR